MVLHTSYCMSVLCLRMVYAHCTQPGLNAVIAIVTYIFLAILVLSFFVPSVLVFQGSLFAKCPRREQEPRTDPYTWFLVRAAGLFLYPDPLLPSQNWGISG